MDTNTRNHQSSTQAAAEIDEQQQAHSRAAGVESENAVAYLPQRQGHEAEDATIAAALAILDRRAAINDQTRKAITSPRDSAEYFRLKLSGRVAESFCVLWLDNRHRVLAPIQELFQGTLDGASVHPREVVRAALEANAAAVILAHNHPSGVAEPSAADRSITHQLRDALQLIGVRVLDHLVIGSGEPTSMAARGLI